MYPWIIVYLVSTIYTVICFIWVMVCSIRAITKHKKLPKIPFIVFLVGVILMILFWSWFREDMIRWIETVILYPDPAGPDISKYL